MIEDRDCAWLYWCPGLTLERWREECRLIEEQFDAINDTGEIVGAVTFPTQPYDAYLWTNGAATDLGHLNGDCVSEAWAINRQGQVVGDSFSCGSTFQHHAFLREDGSLADLNSLVPAGSSLQLVLGNAINDRGEIAGNGVPPGVSPGDVFTLGHAFLLIPCDENHTQVEGCDYGMVDGGPIGAHSTAQTPAAGTATLGASASNLLAAIRQRNHRFSLSTLRQKK